MDKSIPVGAAVLLRFIAKTEVSRIEPECYEVIYGHNQDKLPRPITKMTLAQIQSAQSGWTKNYGSSATGAYQFMKATLAGLITEMKISDLTIFTGDVQDRMGYHLLKRRGYTEFMSGAISRDEFAKRLAQEWASFPVLNPTQGASRKIIRGQSYYAGDGVNKALVNPVTVETILDQIKMVNKGDAVTHVVVDAVVPIPAVNTAPVVPKAAVVVGLVTVLAGAISASSPWLSAYACTMFGLACGN